MCRVVAFGSERRSPAPRAPMTTAHIMPCHARIRIFNAIHKTQSHNKRMAHGTTTGKFSLSTMVATRRGLQHRDANIEKHGSLVSKKPSVSELERSKTRKTRKQKAPPSPSASHGVSASASAVTSPSVVEERVVDLSATRRQKRATNDTNRPRNPPLQRLLQDERSRNPLTRPPTPMRGAPG